MISIRQMIATGLAVSTFLGPAGAQEKRETTTGGQARTAQVVDEELTRLQAAVHADPTDLNARLTLAQRLFEKDKPHEAWSQLRTVYEKAPENQGVLIGLQAVMDGYKRQGLLNVGTSEKEVLALLGEPHQMRKMPWGLRRVYGMMAVDFRDGKIWELVKLIGATPELFDAAHVVDVALGTSRPWHIGIRQKGDGLTTAFLFPEGESVAKWNEMVTIERFVGQAQGRTMKDFLTIVKEQIEAGQPDASVTVIESDDATAILGVSDPAGEGRTAKQQLIRFWLAPRDVHRLAYTHQGQVPTNEDAERWFKIFKNAKLKDYDPSVSRTSLAFSPQNQVKNLAEAVRLDLRKAIQYKPTAKSLSAIAATEEAKKKLQDYSDSIYKELDQGDPPGQPNQTEIIVFGPALEDLAGGYNIAREHFKADVKFYGFKYVVPGEKLGMSFDGVFEVEGKWYFLPKAYRAFQ